ncbi:MAG TPA: GAF domain-containing sensor histidine kinase [Solirubrobacteraceae bacterium]|nr:GAF domain-containing sensor histidine kinase [Solirubrobacteraceae bacterium]
MGRLTWRQHGVATGWAAASGGEESGALAAEQAALRRVATLVARGVSPAEVFAAVVEEVGRLLPVEYTLLGRYAPDDAVTFVAGWGRAGPLFPSGARLLLGGNNLATIIAQTGRAARIDSWTERSGPLGDALRERGVRWSVGTPIMVEGRLWGLMAAGSIGEQHLCPDTEARLAQFTELSGTAIANAESRTGLARLAEEQAALRRVATLVARGVAPEEVCAAAVEEVGQVLSVDHVRMGRYEPDGSATIVASWGRTVGHSSVGSRWMLEGEEPGTLVFETGRPARVDRIADVFGAVDVAVREAGVHSGIGAPIIVEGRLWGVITAGSALEQSLPADSVARLANFTELLAVAIANAESRAALAASRARVVAAADEARRRIERDLHDGAQQQLVSLMLTLRAARATEQPQLDEVSTQLERTERELAGVLKELREISRGIHPAVLSSGGVGPALRVLAHRSPLPVQLDLQTERRLPAHIEVAAYYVVSEALTNAAKHAHASTVKVDLNVRSALVQLAIRDDGIGGANLGQGSGLIGLRDRVEALGGTLQITSPIGSGTTLLIEIPVEGQNSAPWPGP